MRFIELRVMFLGALIRLGAAGAIAGCGSVEPITPTTEPVTDPTKLYLSLTLDHPAVILSKGDTLRLTATPRDALGNPLVGLPAPTFISKDTSTVQVTPDGLVTTVATTSGATVTVSLGVGPIRHTDEAVIVVTDLSAPPTLANVSIHPMAPDSVSWALTPPYKTSNGFNAVQSLIYAILINVSELFTRPPYSGPIVARAVDITDQTISGLPFEYISLDPEVATIERRTGTIHPVTTGQVRLVAQTMAYGISKADTATFTVTTAVMAPVTIQRDAAGKPGFFPNVVRIRPYGLVSFINILDDSVDVTFDDPTHVIAPPAAAVCDWYDLAASQLVLSMGSGPFCGAGDALLPPKAATGNPDFGTDGSESTLQLRQFTESGTYTYHSVRTGATGRIIVNALYNDDQ